MADSHPPKTCLISGASSGIGAATAQRLVEAGHTILGLSRSVTETTHNKHINTICDVTDTAQLQQVVSTLCNQHPIDTVVCNAGVGRFGSLEEFSISQINDLVRINLLSHIHLCRMLLPTLKRCERSNIIFIGSESALTGGRYGAVYSAAKFGLRGFAQSLRHECANSNCHIGMINPGMVRSDFFTDLDFEPGEAADNALLSEDIANAVLQLLESPDHAVIDEININPLKRVVKKKSKSPGTYTTQINTGNNKSEDHNSGGIHGKKLRNNK